MTAKPSPAAAAKPAPAAGAEWDRVVDAAKREGRLALLGPQPEAYRAALLAFNKAYPEITVELTGASGRDVVARLLAERQAGKFLADVHVGGPETAYNQLKPSGVLAPLRPALILPEVLDDDRWLGGLDAGFVDKDRLIFGFQAHIRPLVYVNRDLVPEAELSKIEQLLDPKWRGKVAWNEPRAAGKGSFDVAYLLMMRGEDFARRLLGNDLVVTRDLRQLGEWVVRGTHTVAGGLNPATLAPFRGQGLAANVQPLEWEGELGKQLGQGSGNAMLINRAPHPNAAKVYLNWLLSQEGQAAWVAVQGENSRRLDVPGPPESAPDPKTTYRAIYSEENFRYVEEAIALANEIIK